MIQLLHNSFLYRNLEIRKLNLDDVINGKHCITYRVTEYQVQTEVKTEIKYRYRILLIRDRRTQRQSNQPEITYSYSNVRSLFTLLGTLVHLAIYGVIQSINHAAAARGIKSCRLRSSASVNVHIIHQNVEKA